MESMEDKIQEANKMDFKDTIIDYRNPIEVDYRDPNIVYFVGNSAMPTNTTVGNVFKIGAVGVLMDIRSSLILDANVTLVSPLSIAFIRAQLVGRFLNQDLEQIIKDVDRYQGQARNAIVVALRSIADRYNKYMEKHGGEE